MKNEIKPKILIIGFGWASLGFLNKINYKNFQVEIYSKNKYFNYTPLLAQSITNDKFDNLLTRSVNSFKKVIHKPYNIIDTNFEKNQVTLDNNDIIDYDYLIMAHGSTINYYNIDGLQEFSYKLKDIKDMKKIREKLLNLSANSTIAVMGCGPTGVEIIGSLLDENIHKANRFNIVAIDGMNLPVSMFDKKISNQILNLWSNHNVNIMMNSFVKKINHNKIICQNNNKEKTVNYDLALWCGGVKNNTLTTNILNKYFQNNKKNMGLPVNNYLQIKNKINNTFAIGDCNFTNFPKTAQVAYQQGNYLAARFNNDFKINNPFKFNDMGQFSYIGKYQSVYNGPYFHGGGYIFKLANNCVSMYNLLKTKFF